MAVKTPEEIQIVEEIKDHRPPESLAMLLDAVRDLELAVGRLEDLSQVPGYEAIGRLVPGYVWAIEQTHELNDALATRVFGQEDETAAGRKPRAKH